TAPCAEAAEVSRSAKGVGSSSKDKSLSNGDLREFATQKEKCVASYQLMRAKVAYVARDPNFMAFCRDTAQAIPPAKSPAALDAICKAWQNTAQDTGPLVAAIVGGMQTPLKPEFARETAREIISDPATCAGGNRDQALECLEVNDYRAALAKKDPNSCRGGLCRMLMGAGPTACESYDVEIKKYVCSNFYRARYSAERGPIVEERLRLAEALVSSLSARVTDLRDAQAFTDRLDRVYSLRDRLTQATAILGKLGKSAAKTPAKGSGTNP
ncbi:MAG: hypothetical protein ABL955_04230, partial [Elusimicrobiota bacterium]